VEQQLLVPQLDVRLRPAASARLGLTVGDVRRAATTLVKGLKVGELYRDQKIDDVFVWGAEGVRNDISKLNTLPIESPLGTHVPLSDAAVGRPTSRSLLSLQRQCLRMLVTNSTFFFKCNGQRDRSVLAPLAPAAVIGEWSGVRGSFHQNCSRLGYANNSHSEPAAGISGGLLRLQIVSLFVNDQTTAEDRVRTVEAQVSIIEVKGHIAICVGRDIA
jgi:hypothetical protein